MFLAHSGRSRRARREFRPALEVPARERLLEGRSLAAPAFFSASPYGTVDVAAWTNILFPDGGTNQADYANGLNGNNASATGEGTVIQGGFFPDNWGATDEEQVVAACTVTQPAPGTSANMSAVGITTNFTTQDSVSADTFGPYNVGQGVVGPWANTGAATSGAEDGDYAPANNLNWTLQDGGGGALEDCTEMTMTFNASLTPLSDPRFAEGAYLVLVTPYLDVFINVNAGAELPAGVPQGLTITNPHGNPAPITNNAPTGTVLREYPTWGPGSDFPTTDFPHYFPAGTSPNVGAAFISGFIEGPAGAPDNGGFNNETAVNQVGFTWAFTASANYK